MKEGTYKRIHLPANSLVTFMQSIHNQGRVGTLTVSFGTGGVPSGQLVWEERIEPTSKSVDSTSDIKSATLVTSPWDSRFLYSEVHLKDYQHDESMVGGFTTNHNLVNCPKCKAHIIDPLGVIPEEIMHHPV